jgi:signal transduction histidine kinase
LLIQSRRQRLVKKDADRLQTEVAHAARLAMAGEVAASIAHEVAQPLSAILSNVETAELLLQQVRGDAVAIGDILADIKRDDLRAYEIVRRLRTLLQKREMQFEPLDVNALIASAVTMLRADAARRCISLRTDLAELPPVLVDRVHFQQVILNLLLNAMDALAHMPPAARSIVIRTRTDASSGVEITVSDSGSGMTSDQLARAFESFFTTKEGGMGLGLSIARSIIQAHGGTITAQSVEHGGATFRITLPMSRAKPRLALTATSIL